MSRIKMLAIAGVALFLCSCKPGLMDPFKAIGSASNSSNNGPNAGPGKPPVDPDFLANYTNPEREALPAHRIYPLGQRMMLSAWNPSKVSDVEMLHRNGFTAVGPFENAWGVRFPLEDILKKASDLGMRAWLFLHLGDATLVYKACDLISQGKTDEEIVQPMVNLYTTRYTKPVYNDITDAWLLLPEELSTRLDTCSRSRLLQLNNAVIDKVKELDEDIPQRPIIRTEVEGAGSTNLLDTAKRVASPAAQHYFERGRYKRNAIIQVRAKGVVNYTNQLEANYPVALPRFPAILPGMIYEPKDPSVETMNRYANYYIWTTAILGFKSYSLYKLDKNVAGGNLKRAYMSTIKEFTDHGFDQAFLWGNKTPDHPLTIKRTAGPENADFANSSTWTYRAESLLSSDIQFGDKRYIAITNSHWAEGDGSENDSGALTVEISGLPVGEYKLRDCKTNTVEKITSSTKTIKVEPEGYRIFKVEK